MTDIAALTTGSTVIDFFLSITCIDMLTALRVFFCDSGAISLSFRVSIQLTVLLAYCSLFISMASIPTLSAIRKVKCCQIIVCDNRIVGPSMFGVEAYTHCLLKISSKCDTYIGQVQSVENVLQRQK